MKIRFKGGQEGGWRWARRGGIKGFKGGNGGDEAGGGRRERAGEKHTGHTVVRAGWCAKMGLKGP